MFLKSLELNGFKSFAEKTTLEFPKGITAIVGPNGSGKSNIIDAIRWILGERDPKALRGAKAEDLVWNGSPRRARMSVAQASLYFDNRSGLFPVDMEEVVLSRRVDRDGISTYALNKAEVRLKDVIDFLSHARLGTKGLIIIGQGLSDLFVRVSGEDRRVMIEEILGLREYQLKKLEAERKLKNTIFNLEKVRAMIEEVLPRLRLLRRQTSKWEKREEVARELEELESVYFGSALRDFDGALKKINAEIQALDQQADHKRQELGSLEANLRGVEKKGDAQAAWKEIQKRKNELSAERSRIERDLARMEAALETKKIAASGKKSEGELLSLIQEVRSLLIEIGERDDLLKIREDIRRALQRIAEVLDGSVAEEAPDDGERSSEKEAVIRKLKDIESRIGELEKEEAGIAEGLETFNRRFKEAFEALEAKKEELRRLDADRSRFIFEREKIDLKMDDLAREAGQAGRKIEEFKNKNFTGERSSESERRMLRLRAELAAIGDVDEALIKEAEEVQKHYEFLKTQSEDLESALQDLRSMIKELGKKIHDEFEGSLRRINEEFNKFFHLMFGGGTAKLKIKNYEIRIRNNEEEGEEGEKKKKKEKEDQSEEPEIKTGVEIELSLPKKRISNLDMLSGGEKSLVSVAALFALISVSPPPFLVLDEVDAPLDESNSRRFANLIREFSKNTQFIVVTHNRSSMEAADVLYGITMGDDGASRVLSVRLEEAVKK